MSNVVAGNARGTPEQIMRAFDRLPPALRAAFANAVENWDPRPFLEPRYADCTLALRTLERDERDELAGRYGARLRADGPYKGNAPDARGVKISPRRHSPALSRCEAALLPSLHRAARDAGQLSFELGVL